MNKHMILSFIIILIALVFITIINYIIYKNIIPTLYSSSKNYINKSRVGGRGIFAGQNYKKGDIIEIAHGLIDNIDLYKNTIIIDYLFQIDNNKSLICFGNGSLYSHSDDPNCTYDIEKDTVYFTCIRPIKKDEEIFISYGDEWWKSRKQRITKIK